MIVFTSGTTSAPRAVVHTRASLAAGMRAVDALVRPRPGRTVLGGTTFVLVPALAAGATVALPARRSRTLQRQIDRLTPDETYLTPPQLRPLTRLTGRVWTGSAPADATLLRRAKAAGATEAWGVYALTELFPAAAVEEADKSAHQGPGDLLGHPLPGVRTRLTADGELLLAAPAARDRYLGESPDPWVRTGDRARLDPDGRIVLAGRLKDMVLRRAENIYPGLYEPSLHLPDVELAVLVGVPAPDGDEQLVALVQPRPGADPHRLRAALRTPLARMGSARPDALLLGPVPSPAVPTNPTARPPPTTAPDNSPSPADAPGPGGGEAPRARGTAAPGRWRPAGRDAATTFPVPALTPPPPLRSRPPPPEPEVTARTADRTVYLRSHPVLFALLAATRHRPLLRLGRTVLVHHPDAYREILTRLPLDRTAEHTTGGTAARLTGGGLLFDQSGPEHRGARRELTSLLGSAGIAELRPHWHRILSDGLSVPLGSGPVDLVPVVRRLAGATAAALTASTADPVALARAAEHAAATTARTHLPSLLPRPGADRRPAGPPTA
ncbi:AMP-binding protein [Kitasatospora cheerisanensis]|uniref:Acyl-CoA synthetase n=1 Tax=Kitasatospora cheerisanensis KCTC 2395 TaxID=1348663 RepID=A0A066YRS2_9ACTN|nr:AMP-binding protein [Kitasatospora cheerisanensis]KDN84238.1 acyl-CoA synthetase [Kitasatospora cheerisanensis KCTC 2395]